MEWSAELSYTRFNILQDAYFSFSKKVGDYVNKPENSFVQEDLQLVVPVLDAFSNMNLEPELFDQVSSF